MIESLTLELPTGNSDRTREDVLVHTTALQDDGKRKKSRAFYMSFLALLIMVLLVSLDVSILAVAIPVITHELNGTTLEAFWASISFLLAVVIVQPIYTSVSNVMGRMMPIYASFMFFIVGSIVFALSRSMAVLITGRVLQGLGSGGLDVLSEVILADITTLKERPLYLGMLGIPLGGGAILGPILGGVLSEYATWRWIGWINLPVSAFGLALVFFFLQLRAIDRSFRESLHRLDWVGMALFTVGCTLFASPVAWAGAMFPWSSWKTILPLCLGVVLLLAFSWYESKPAEPVFPYRIFKRRTASITLVVSVIHGIVTYSMILYVPLFFQAVYLNAPLQSAVSVLPLCCSTIGFSVISAVAVESVRKYRLIILASWVCTAVSVGLFTLWDRSASLAVKASFQVLAGIGTGTLFTIIPLPIQASVQHVDDMGLAAGILVSFRLFGGLIGLSTCSTLFNSRFTQETASLGPFSGPLAALSDVREAIGFIPLLRETDVTPEVLDAVIDAYKTSMFAVFWMLAGFSVAGFLVSFLIKEIPMETEELGVQQFEEK
ncbi:MFS general substrate transporter [Jackrogersella minutella]|nr:MFS general substrate transporter [Jackrogersella minutella]